MTIHDQIESRPLKKAQAQAESSAGHHPPSDATESEVVEEEEEVVEVEEAVLKDFDTELDRVFKILKDVRDQFYEEVEKGSKKADVKVRPLAPLVPCLSLARPAHHLVFKTGYYPQHEATSLCGTESRPFWSCCARKSTA